MDNIENNNQLEVELTDQVASGIYSNLACISNSSGEFFLDFLQLLPNVPKAVVRSRIILTPESAKRLSRLLDFKINSYEHEFGEIRLHEELEMPPVSGAVGKA